ncbi:MAG: hypothetical protein E4H21_06815 [Thermodesulfobacteriales bacterium]|jgi:hypothetical protein|nr:MAG: hypothetical protein E4H21_06815 [Thermodesulfobacteriales bacterium]
MSEDKPRGKQKNVSEIAKELGLLIPVYLTSFVWENWVTPDQKSIEEGEDEKIRASNLINSFLYYMRVHRQTSKSNLIYFPVNFKKNGEEESVQLMSYLGPLQEGDNRPCITIMTPEEYESETAH